ncbi:hypothetical protein BJ742DRAFT_845807 [Cladochytrium replicatum]|nr:hypothetical protein BJ742DRAFT_845807 [Cladochytrium replicatum]
MSAKTILDVPDCVFANNVNDHFVFHNLACTSREMRKRLLPIALMRFCTIRCGGQYDTPTFLTDPNLAQCIRHLKVYYELYLPSPKIVEQIIPNLMKLNVVINCFRTRIEASENLANLLVELDGCKLKSLKILIEHYEDCYEDRPEPDAVVQRWCQVILATKLGTGQLNEFGMCVDFEDPDAELDASTYAVLSETLSRLAPSLKHLEWNMSYHREQTEDLLCEAFRSSTSLDTLKLTRVPLSKPLENAEECEEVDSYDPHTVIPPAAPIAYWLLNLKRIWLTQYCGGRRIMEDLVTASTSSLKDEREAGLVRKPLLEDLFVMMYIHCPESLESVASAISTASQTLQSVGLWFDESSQHIKTIGAKLPPAWGSVVNALALCTSLRSLSVGDFPPAALYELMTLLFGGGRSSGNFAHLGAVKLGVYSETIDELWDALELTFRWVRGLRSLRSFTLCYLIHLSTKKEEDPGVERLQGGVNQLRSELNEKFGGVGYVTVNLLWRFVITPESH